MASISKIVNLTTRQRANIIALSVKNDFYPRQVNFEVNASNETNSVYFLCYKLDELVGFCNLYWGESDKTELIEIQFLLVDEAERGKNIASQLGEQIFKHFIEIGDSKPILAIKCERSLVRASKKQGFFLTDQKDADHYIMTFGKKVNFQLEQTQT